MDCERAAASSESCAGVRVSAEELGRHRMWLGMQDPRPVGEEDSFGYASPIPDSTVRMGLGWRGWGGVAGRGVTRDWGVRDKA